MRIAYVYNTICIQIKGAEKRICEISKSLAKKIRTISSGRDCCDRCGEVWCVRGGGRIDENSRGSGTGLGSGDVRTGIIVCGEIVRERA